MENLFKSMARFGWHPRLREGIVHNLNHAEQTAQASIRYDFEGFLQSFALSLEIYTNWVTQLIAASPWLFQEMEMPECILEVHSIMSFTAMTHALAGLLVQQSFSAYEGLSYREFTQCRFRMRILVATLQFIIAYVPGVDKHVAMWGTSFAWLVLCTRSSTLDRYSLSLKMKVKSLGLHPSMYSFEFFRRSNIVYMKVPFQFDVAWILDTKRLTCSTPNRRNWKRYWYIGSSSLTATARDCNRATKLRQVSAKKLVKTELAVQWWSEKDNFLDYATVVLGAYSSYKLAWAMEHKLIQTWQPTLNWPIIGKVLKPTAFGLRRASRRVPGLARGAGDRLWAKLRRKHHTLQHPVHLTVTLADAWVILHDLSELSKRSFEASKRLRSGKHTVEEVYALYRLTNHIAEPLKACRARQVLKGVLKFRNASVPRKPFAFRVPFLSHSSFPGALKKFLKALVLKHKSVLVPLHLPPCTPIESAHQSLDTVLHNWMRLVPHMQEHQHLPEMQCSCKEWLQRRPNLNHVNGHIAAGLEEFNLVQDLAKFNWINAQSTFFPARRQYNSMFQDAFDAWWRRNQFPRWSKPDLTEFIHDQWKQHLNQLNKEERLDFKSVQKLKQFFSDNFVIHNEDHCSGHVMIFCPNFYYSTQWRTWTDEAVFTRLPYAPREYQQAFAQQIPQDLRKRYSWGFKSDPRCPRGSERSSGQQQGRL